MTDDLKMLKVDRQTDDSLTGNRNVHLNPQAWIFRDKNLSQNKNYLTFTQIFESFLKVEKTRIFAFENTLIYFFLLKLRKKTRLKSNLKSV